MTILEAIAAAEAMPATWIPVGERGHRVRYNARFGRFSMYWPKSGRHSARVLPYGVYRAPTESYEDFWARVSQ